MNSSTEEVTRIQLIITPGQQPMRIDQYLAQQIENATRSKVQEGIKAGWVLVNEIPIRSSYLIQPGDVIDITLPKPPPPEAVPEEIPLDVVFEDAFLMIVNKPAGMVVHPAYGNWSGTLVNAVLHHAQELKEWETDEDETVRPGIVHRLDKDTSGLIVIAKNEVTHAKLSALFAQHDIEREYEAIVWGAVPASGTIQGDIARSKKDRKVMAIVPDGEGKHAVTHFSLIETIDVLSRVRVHLETGRTHQIRVHFASKGWPVFGDRTYGGDQIRFGQNIGMRKHFFQKLLDAMPRQSLHARVLGFVHPNTGENIRFEAEPPADFLHVWSEIQRWTKM